MLPSLLHGLVLTIPVMRNLTIEYGFPIRSLDKELAMRKKQYVRDALNSAVTPDGTTVEVTGWIKSRRRHGRVAFLDIVDSTGAIQVVARVQ